jgi:hypothetical protein
VIYSELVQKENRDIKIEPGHINYAVKWVLEEKGEAMFLAFGVDYEQLDMTAGMYSTAIIELADGSVKNVPAEHIKFISGELGGDNTTTLTIAEWMERCGIKLEK